LKASPVAKSTRETPIESTPGELPRTPPPYSAVVEFGGIAESLMQIQKSIGELTAHVEQTNSRINIQEQNFRSDFRWTWTGLAATAVLLIGALIFGYFRLDDKAVAVSTGLTKVETKVDALLQRTPAPTILPQR
jgi:hypothetical protein